MQEILHDLQQKLAKEEQEKNRLVEEKSLAEKHSVEATKMKEVIFRLEYRLDCLISPKLIKKSLG